MPPAASLSRLFRFLAVTAFALTTMMSAAQGRSETFSPPEILLLGDSQISFGAGEELTGFFGALETECADVLTDGQRESLKGLRLGVLGARQTSLRAWTARKGKPKWLVCGKDPTWGVNTSTFGVLRSEKRGKYEQIGETPGTQFCAAGRTPFEEMFRPGYYAPKLFVMWFLGNDSGRWARNPEDAAADVAAMEAQIPPDMPCLFMTTAPSYRAAQNRKRLSAQQNILDAFQASGRCSTVPGLTPETIAALQGMSRFYRRHDDGRVKDPYHPLRSGAKKWLELRRDAICEAVADVLPMPASVDTAGAADRAPPPPAAWRKDQVSLDEVDRR